MSLLLDTHVWIWSQEVPEKLGPGTTALLSDPRTALHVSTISTLEIARLVTKGTIELDGSLGSWVNATLDSLHCATLEISHQVAIGAYALPGTFHKDPADRIIVSTSRLLDLTLVTADEKILKYPHVKTRDARQ